MTMCFLDETFKPFVLRKAEIKRLKIRLEKRRLNKAGKGRLRF
jgi:hypothetical protein